MSVFQKIPRSIVLVLFFTVPLLAASRSQPVSPKPKQAREAVSSHSVLQINGLRAYLYYHEKGSFDDRDALSGKVALRNVYIGEGDALARSGATMIMVDIEGPGVDGALSGLFLNVGAQERGRKIGSTRLPLDTFVSSAKRISIPVIFYGRFCSELGVTARLEGVPGEHPFYASVPFTCGE